ncbi:kinase-like domain-containing protein, partial [Kalaharituber pfeilii]
LDFLALLSLAQYVKLDVIHTTWDEMLKKLGEGATSNVRQARGVHKSAFAFKQFKQYSDPQKLYMAIIPEILLLTHPLIREHTHIVKLEAVCFEVVKGGDSSNENDAKVLPLLLFEKAHHGSLRSFMEGVGKTISFRDKLAICAGVGSAILTMHESNIIHGDIKPDNILVYENPEKGEAVVAKLTDFGYSTMGANEDSAVALGCTPAWCAPEYHTRKFTVRDAKKTDIYSFAMVCAWLLF